MDTPHLTPSRARAIGSLGAANRWARDVTPAARQQATRAARAKRLAQFLDQAQRMANERGEELTMLELAERAQRLQDAYLAGIRLRRTH